MSATFEKEIFVSYFEIPKENYLVVKGQTYPKELHFEKNNLLNWQERATEIVKEIHTSEDGIKDIFDDSKTRDIIIFVAVNSDGNQLVGSR